MMVHLIDFLSVFIPLTAVILVCYPPSFAFSNGGVVRCPGSIYSHFASGMPVDPGKSGSGAPPRWSPPPFSGSCLSF